MIALYGPEFVNEMIEKKFSEVKRTIAELNYIEQGYKIKLEKLRKEKNNE
jgi:hypothetical protein